MLWPVSHLRPDVHYRAAGRHQRRRTGRTSSSSTSTASSGTKTPPGGGTSSSRTRPSPTTSSSPPPTSTATAGSTSRWATTGTRPTPAPADRPVAQQRRDAGEHGPSTHRRGADRGPYAFVDLDVTGRPYLVVMPLMGRDSTPARNWLDGRPIRVPRLPRPEGPGEASVGCRKCSTRSMHVVQTSSRAFRRTGNGRDLLTASYDGVSLCALRHEVDAEQVGAGNQEHPGSNRGSSEVKQGTPEERRAPTSPPSSRGTAIRWWSTPRRTTAQGLWDRHVLDHRLQVGPRRLVRRPGRRRRRRTDRRRP